MSKTFDRYLYAIGMLKEKYLCVRAVDVAHCLGVSKASVSVVIRQLRDAVSFSWEMSEASFEAFQAMRKG